MLIPLLSTVAAICALYLILLLLVSPTDRTHPDIGLLKGAYIAHRGLHNKDAGIPENSLLSFEKAIEKGFPIEIDIHLTKDRRVVVFHDRNVKRMCGVEGRVEEMTLEELRSLSLLDTDEKIPTLEETLEKVGGKVFLLIEFKMVENNTKELCEEADKILSQYHGTYFVQSFYPQVLRWYKKNRKTVCRGLLASIFKNKPISQSIPGTMLLNFISRPDFISYQHERADFPLRRFAVWLGAESVGWTFRSQKDVDEKKKDFNTFIFENFLPEEE